MELIQYAFFQNALLGSLFTAIACGIVGTYIVMRRLVFICGGITHASFGGLGLGFFLGINPILTALLFSILSAFGVEWVSKSQQVREDSAIAGVWSFGIGCHLHFPYARLCTQFVRLSVWEHINDIESRYLGKCCIGIGTCGTLFPLYAGDYLCRIRCQFCPNPTVAGEMDRICHDVLYCHHHCPFHPYGGNHVVDEFDDIAPNNSQPNHIRLSENPLGKYLDCLFRLCRRLSALLLPEYSVRCFYHIGSCSPVFAGKGMEKIGGMQ